MVDEPFTIGGVVLHESVGQIRCYQCFFSLNECLTQMYATLKDIMAANTTVTVRVTSGGQIAIRPVHDPHFNC